MAAFPLDSIMADILAFPREESGPAEDAGSVAYDRFLLDEGLELLGAFRSIEDREVRDSLRTLVKAMALVSRRITTSRD